MDKNRYYYPIPEVKLLARFGGAFRKLSEGQSATILALPHTGRTSHLRFIASDKSFRQKLGLDKKCAFVFIDSDRSGDTFESLLTEMLHSIHSTLELQPSDSVKNAVFSKDTYLLSREVYDVVSKVSETQSLVLALTLKKRHGVFIKDLDAILVHSQKSAKLFPLSVLFSIDTEAYSQYQPGHLSSSFLDNIFYFPTFDTEETSYSLKRKAKTKNVLFSLKQQNGAQKNTGGIAAFFHQYLNSDNNFWKALNELPFNQTLIADLKAQEKKFPDLFFKLTTDDARKFLMQFETETYSYQQIKLTHPPTAQEINLLKNFLSHEGNPISRDQVAESLWGLACNSKYSDWAIDKAISRLRKNMLSKEYKIITVKNLGYQLIKLV